MGSRIALVTAGDPRRLTGGNICNRYLLQGLDAEGLSADQVVLPPGQPAEATRMLWDSLAVAQPDVAILDSIAVEAAAPLVTWRWQRPDRRLLALMYMVPSDLASGFRHHLLRSLEIELLAQADCVVTLSEHVAERLEAAGAAGSVVVVLPGRNSVPATRKKASSGDTAVRFLCVANWSPSKQVHSLVEAMARLSAGAELDLVGDEVDPEYAATIRGLIESNNLEQRIRLRGPLHGKALAQCYAEADVFVLPSRSESFGIVYAEAMSFGLPVVACEIGPLPWLVEAGCGVLVPPDDTSALASAMESLASEPMLRDRMGKAARRRAARLPTWRQSQARMISILREQMAERFLPQRTQTLQV